MSSLLCTEMCKILVTRNSAPSLIHFSEAEPLLVSSEITSQLDDCKCSGALLSL